VTGYGPPVQPLPKRALWALPWLFLPLRPSRSFLQLALRFFPPCPRLDDHSTCHEAMLTQRLQKNPVRENRVSRKEPVSS
jgi:hypothetical protein